MSCQPDEELLVTDKLLEERNRVMEAIPPCPRHGSQCVPHALEWVEAHRKQDDDEGWLSKEAAEGMRRLTKEEARQDSLDVAPYRVVLKMMRHIFGDGVPGSTTYLLDVGCGVGHYARLVDTFYPLVSYCGCDISRDMIEFARADHDHGEDRFFVCDATKLTVGADIILASSLMEVCGNWEEILAHLLSLDFQWLILHRVRVFGYAERPTEQKTYQTIYGTEAIEVTHNWPELLRLIADGGGEVTHTLAYQVGPDAQLLCLLVEKTK